MKSHCPHCGGDLHENQHEKTPPSVNLSQNTNLKSEKPIGRATATKTIGAAGAIDCEADESALWFGDYKIEKKIGEGGMGIVYLAEQPSVGRRVALKMLKSRRQDPEAKARFEREITTLALLKHPSIAAIYDAGETENGRQFFTMELIEGVSLEVFLAAPNKSLLDANEELRFRLDLFLKICEAINYAHQRGIINRDIKPSNILVLTDGDSSGQGSAAGRQPGVKILDFGLARIIESDTTVNPTLTEVGKIQGTLYYMSPEQTRGISEEIDLRTDIYSLGVVLFEMLTGSFPYQLEGLSWYEAMQRISQASPKPLRKAIRQTREQDPSTRYKVDRDLEIIVAKSLQKDPQDRYQNVFDFAEDIRRYINNQPIFARPPSTAYQIRKLVARHRTAALLSGLLAISLVLFGVAMVFQNARISEEAENARRQASTSSRVTDFMVGLFRVADPDLTDGKKVTARELLVKGADDIDKDLKEEPEIKATLLHSMGRAFSQLGMFDDAGNALDKAWFLRNEELGENHPDTLYTLNLLADLYWKKGETVRALQTRIDIVERARDFSGEKRSDLVEYLDQLGLLYFNLQKFSQAEEPLRQKIALQRRSLGANHPDVASSLNNLSYILRNLGKIEDCREVLEESYAILEASEGDYSRQKLAIRSSLGNLAMLEDNFQEARAIFLRVEEMTRETYGENSPRLNSILFNLGVSERQLGLLDEAMATFRKSLKSLEDTYGEGHPRSFSHANQLAEILIDRGEFAESLVLLQQNLQWQTQKLEKNHRQTLLTNTNIGSVLTMLGRHQEAEATLRGVVELTPKEGESFILDSAYALSLLGQSVAKQGRLEEAEDFLKQGYELSMSSNRENRRTKRCRDLIIQFYENTDRHQLAERYRR